MSKSFVIKSIQYAFLKELSFSEVREFWDGISYKYNGEELNELEIQQLYTNFSDVPVSFLLQVLNKAGALENNYVKIINKNIGSFFSSSSPFSNELMPFAIDVILEVLTGVSKNSIEVFLDMYPTLINTFLKFYNVKLVKKGDVDNRKRFVFLATTYRNDSSYKFFNHTLYIKNILENFSKLLRPQALPEYRSYLEASSYRMFLNQHIDTEIRKGKIYNVKNGKAIGEFVSINEFFDTLDCFNCDDVENIFNEKLGEDFGKLTVAKFYNDVCIYTEGNKKRVKLLDKNTAYNASIYLYEIQCDDFNLEVDAIKILMKNLIFYTSADYSKIVDDLVDLQDEYIKYLSLQKYNHIDFKNGYILENGKVITKSTPAKILWYLLSEYKKGRDSFSYKELIMNADIFTDSESHNISKRLSRLSTLLGNNSDIVTMRLSGDGRCNIDVHQKFTLKQWNLYE